MTDIPVGAQRHRAKLKAGISSVRKDGSIATEENHIKAAEAEQFACEYYGQPFNDEIYTHGDGGVDFRLDLTVQVKWWGIDKQTGKPRNHGFLIVGKDEPQRWADIYVLVGGPYLDGYLIIGWTTHQKVVQGDIRNWGYAGDTWSVPSTELYHPDTLSMLKRSIWQPKGEQACVTCRMK